MIVVSDTTPLRYLSVLGHLGLPPRLFGSVHFPAEVIIERHWHCVLWLKHAQNPSA